MMGKPKIRFKGYNEDWEQRKVSEMFKVARGYVLPATDTSQEMTDEIPYPVYSSQTKDNGLMGYYSDYLYEDAITWTTDGANAGTVNFRAGKFYCTNVCGVLLSDKIETNKVIAEALNNVAKRYVSYVGNPKLMNNVMADIQIAVPTSQKERDRISSYFSYLDHLITLHQHKCDEMKRLKKYMLQKMFPQNGKKVPEIRFDGFTNGWEQRKLGETKTFFTDGNYGEAYPKSSDMVDSSIGVPFLTGGNLKDGKLDISGASYISKEKHELLTSGHLICDDIVIAVRGSLGALGYVNSDNSGWNINSQLAILRTDKEELNGKFLLQFLLSENGQKEFLRRQTGTALKQLPIGAIKDVDIPITSIDEQVKIGEYFATLDHLITLHQRKIYIFIKKMPIDWEQRKLGEVFEFQYGEFNNNPDNGGEYPIYGANGIIGGYTDWNAENSSIIGHMGAYAGYVVWGEGKHFVTYNGTIARPKDNSIDSKYGYYLLDSKKIYKICAGSGQPFVSYSDLNGIDILLPKDKDEQRLLAYYFTNLDHLITLHQHKCDELQNLKKYMLQNMFV